MQLGRDLAIVIDDPQPIAQSDLSVDSSDWDSIERAIMMIAACAVAVQ